MNWPWTRKEAILIITNINDKEIAREYKIANRIEIADIILHVQANQNAYCESIKEKYNLNKLPSIEIKLVDYPYPDENTITVKAEIIYIYNGKMKEKAQPKDIARAIFAIIASAVLTGMAFTMFMIWKENHVNTIQNRCFIYFKNNVPYTMYFSGEEFRLDPDGTINNIDLNFIPWEYKDMIRQQECIRIYHE